MADAKISCLKCGGHIAFPKELAGQEVSCPHCNESLLLPKTKPSTAWILAAVFIFVIVCIASVAIWVKLAKHGLTAQINAAQNTHSQALVPQRDSLATGQLVNASTGGGQKFYCVDGTKLDFATKLMLESLQALANSNTPVLFAIQRPQDLSWRQTMEKSFGQTSEMISVDEALAHFGANAPQVIWNWDYSWSRSFATTLAGINHALLTDHKLEGHEVAYDFNNSGLTNKVQAYRWALAEVLPQCNHNQLVYLDEGLTWLRDYAMQQKLFVFNLDPLNDPEDGRLLDEILSRYPAQTRVFGWASGNFARKDKNQNGVTVENALVNRLSKRGMLLVPADYAGNLSFYIQTQPYVTKFKQQRIQRNLNLQPGKRFVLLVVSDGDNLQINLGAMRTWWEDYQTLHVPLAWTISPQLVDVAPAVLQFYYQETAKLGGWSEFVAGPSGYGYVNPGSLNRVQLMEFVQQTRQACERADIRSVAILDNGSRPAAQVFGFIQAYAEAKFDGLWLMAMPTFLGVSDTTVFANEDYRLKGDNSKAIVAAIADQKDDQPFAVIYLPAGADMDYLREFVSDLNRAFTIVSPTEMARLIREWKKQSR